ncbi:MAG: MFS transporter [Deltaproteobacteria bacterium]|nr:MFS transporter [Deltaproteobacteria bacterium]
MATTGRIDDKIFHGWWVVLAAGIGASMSYGPIIAFTFGVFIKPFNQEFGWSRTDISLGFSLSLLMLSGTAPFVGQLVDRFGARKVIIPSVFLFGFGIISFYFLSASLWHFYAIYVGLGIVSVGAATLPYLSVVSRWFDKRRGLALGLAMVGVGLGTFVMPSFAQTLIDAVGWRYAYVILGLLVMGVTIPVVALFLKDTPEQMGLAPDGERAERPPTTVATGHAQGMRSHEVWRLKTFWRIVAAFFLMSVSVHGCLIHLVPMLTDYGLSAKSAALATSVLGGALLIGRVGAGYLLDRFLASSVAIGFLAGATLGVFLLWHEAVGVLAFAAAIFIGLGVGAETDLMPYVVSRYFGLRAFGEIYGCVVTAWGLGGVTGPFLMGVGFDSTGSYSAVLVAFMAATLFAAGLMAGLGPYRVWETSAETA